MKTLSSIYLLNKTCQMAIISNNLIINYRKWLPYGICDSFQVIQCEDAAGQETEQVISLEQSQIEGTPQVFVALGDQQEAASGAGIVAVSMEDLLNGTVTLICEEGQ